MIKFQSLSLQTPNCGPKRAQNREILVFCGKSSMGTLEKSLENHEFATVRKRFAKNHDFHFRTAPDHGKEAFWPRTRKFTRNHAKTLLDIRSVVAARRTHAGRSSLPSNAEQDIQTIICSHLAAPPPVRRCIFLLVTYLKLPTYPKLPTRSTIT